MARNISSEKSNSHLVNINILGLAQNSKGLQNSITNPNIPYDKIFIFIHKSFWCVFILLLQTFFFGRGGRGGSEGGKGGRGRGGVVVKLLGRAVV